MGVKKAGIYIRTSTDNQKESINLQRKELREYCNRVGYKVVEEYVDFGFSGKTTERPAFSNMMEDASNNFFDILLVTKIDRFARSIIDCLISVEKLNTHGVGFAATSQPIDTSSAMGKLTLQIMSAFAEFERSIITERMEAGRKAAEKRGVICHRPRKDINKRQLEDLVGKGFSASACAKFFGVVPDTIIKRLTEMGYVYHNGEWRKHIS